MPQCDLAGDGSVMVGCVPSQHTISDHDRPASETPLEWRFAGGLKAYNLGPRSPRQRNAIRMAFRWRAGSGPLLCAYEWICKSQSSNTAGGEIRIYKSVPQAHSPRKVSVYLILFLSCPCIHKLSYQRQ